MKGTCSVSKLRDKKRSAKRSARRVRIGVPDGSLTGLAGLAAVDELTAGLGLVSALDAGIGAIKTRARGLSAGQLLLGMATAQLVGQEWLVGLDRVRADAGAALLIEAPVAPSTTAGSLARRFGPAALAGIESGLTTIYARWLALAPVGPRTALTLRVPTIDLDASDVEVYGTSKEQIGWTYAGVRAGRLHLASWAQAELPLAAELLAGNDDPRPTAVTLLKRALAVLPAAVCGRTRVRADAGYFSADLARGAVDAGCDFAIAAKRNSAAWRALAGIEAAAWRPARDMHNAQVAACDYAPAGWPPGTYTIVRRVRVPAEEISADGRSRRRRTIAKDQLALALGGQADHAYAVSFIVTNIPADDGDYVGLEAWFRNRTSIEERFREAKLGAGLNHLPSADHGVNTVWMWAGLLAGALNVMLQSLTGPQHYARHGGRVRIDTLCHQLLNVPGRLVRHARGLTLRLPPEQQNLTGALARLRALPAPT